MQNAIVVVNAGSSSIKFSFFAQSGEKLELYGRGQVEGLYTAPRFVAKDRAGKVMREKSWDENSELGHDGAIDYLGGFLRELAQALTPVGVGHRVAHGGLKFTAPARIDEDVLTALTKLVPLAPLHQPHNLTPIRRFLERRPELPQVACFDTSFHRTNSGIAQRFAIPAELHDAGVQRYGFHGLSYEYIASVLPQFDAKAAVGRTVVLHLGNGASMCALQAGKSIATTMGFTALEGLPMGTRCGSIDPGAILFLIDQRGMDSRAVAELLYTRSGLLGVSGISSDMRTLLTTDEPRAKLAIDLYVYRIQRELGSLAAALGGLDAIVFTGGIGENSSEIRARVCRDAAWLGVQFDAEANDKQGPRIGAATSPVSAWVIPTNEELMIAQHTLRLLGDNAMTEKMRLDARG
jgi:acetate kinase